MLKWFNKKKKDNKGFTLVELIVVVAILAILVGLLAPQYTKYVERSRKAADAANLDSLVTAVKVATADQQYADIIPEDSAKITITIGAEKTTVVYNKTNISDSTANYPSTTSLKNALNEYAGNEWSAVTLKSKAWKNEGKVLNEIKAVCTVGADGSVTVEYTPSNVKNTLKETN